MNLNQNEVIRKFVGFYGEEYLKEVGAEVDVNNKNNWVTSIVRKYRTISHTRQHLLMIQFLELDIDEVFSKRVVKKQKAYEQKSIEEVQFYRAKWSHLLKDYHKYNTSNLRRIDTSTYTWLYIYDNMWLKENLPKRKREGNNSNIDWNKRDLEVLEEVKRAVSEILEHKGKPERVSIGAVGRRIGKTYLLQRNLDKLQMTKEYLDKNIESVEVFQERRYKWVSEKFSELLKWEKIRKIGLNNEVIV